MDLLADTESVAASIRITGGSFGLLDRRPTQVARHLTLSGLKQLTREAVEAVSDVMVIGTV